MAAVQLPPARSLDPQQSDPLERGWVLDALVVTILAGVVFCLARQRTLYGDGSFLLLEIIGGDLYHSHHLAYKSLAHVVYRAVAWLGVTPYAAVVACSAVGSAIGIGSGYLGLRLFDVPRRPALAAAAAAGLAPGVVFFASVIEYHGVFFGFAGVAFAAAGWLARTPSPARAVLFGASTWLAYTMHATGHLLPATFGIVVVTQRWRKTAEPRGRAVAILALAAVVHAALAFLVARVLERGGRPVSSHSLSLIATYLEMLNYRWLGLFGTLRGDLLIAFFPLSLLWLTGFWRGDQRMLATALALVLLPYLGAAYVLTGGNDERGAYLLPVVWPMALLVVRALPWRWLVAGAVAAMVLAFARVIEHDQPERSRAFARGLLAQVAARDAALIVSDGLDMHAALIEVDAAQRLPVRLLVTTPPATHDDFVRDLPGHLHTLLGRGKRVFLTDEAAAQLDNAEFGRLYPVAPRILSRLQESFTLAPASRDGFHASELRPKNPGGR